MNEVNRVTVLMTVYNGLPFLKESVTSILEQTYSDFTFLIIDDCSTDGSCDYLESIDDPRLRLIKNEQNIGQTKSLNKGLSYVDTPLVMRMDADDISIKNRIELQLRAFDRSNNIAILGCQVEHMSENAEFIENYIRPCNDVDIKWLSLFESPMSGGSFLFRTEIIRDEFRGYCEEIKLGQDFELTGRVSSKYSVRSIPDILYRARVHRASSTQMNLDNLVKEELKNIRKSNLNCHFPNQEDYHHQLVEIHPSVLKVNLIMKLYKLFIEAYPEARDSSFIQSHILSQWDESITKMGKGALLLLVKCFFRNYSLSFKSKVVCLGISSIFNKS